MNLKQSRRRKILIITAVFPPEPVVSARLSWDIANELSIHDDVIVLAPRPSRPKGFIFKDVIEIKKFQLVYLDSFIFPDSGLFGRVKESYSLGKCSAKYISKNKNDIDCIYINSWPLASQFLIVKAAKRFNIPCVIHIQDIYPESLMNKLPKFARTFFYQLLLPLDKYILRNATKILGISEKMISYLSTTRNIEKSKFTLVRNWQDDNLFLNFVPQKDSSSPFTFMYVGSLSPSAGVEILLQAFHQAKLDTSRLLIVGDGAEKEKCVELTKKLDIQNVYFLEVIPERVAEMQAQADVLLLPLKKGISLNATPSKLTAYLLSAKPIIACVEPESDVAKIINETDCGLIVEPENIEAIATCMKNVHSITKYELELKGRRGREYANLHLTKNANLGKIVNLLDAITS